MTAARLELRDVVVTHGGVRAVDGVNLAVEPSEIVGFIGPNGSGKTTLLDTISGQLLPAEGAVLLDGDDLIDHLPRTAPSSGRAFVPGRSAVSGSDGRRLAARRRGRATSRQCVGDDVRAAQRAAKGVGEARGGCRIAPAVRVDPLSSHTYLPTVHRHETHRRSRRHRCRTARLLLLDEPTAGIAQREAEAFGPLLRRLHDLTEATICIVEHDVPLVVALADRLVVMETGKVVSAGPVDDVLRDPVAIDAYLGASREAIARSGAHLDTTSPKKVRVKKAATSSRAKKQAVET